MREFNNPWAQQNRFEFNTWLTLLRAARPRSLLEVGSCLGHSLVMMARCLPLGSRIVSIDLGIGAGDLKGKDTGRALRDRLDALRAEGYDVHQVIGDSHAPAIVARASHLGPFDACFIDGDHTFDGVKEDWLNYGRLASITGLHDIVNASCDVWQWWDELKKERGRATVEIVGSRMGIGVVYNGVTRGADTGSEFAGWK